MNWQMATQLALLVTRKDSRALNIALARIPGNGWIAVVVEQRKPDEDASAIDAIAATLEEHAHAQLTPMPTLGEAIQQAEKYARWWQRSGETHEECPCDVIASTIAAPA